MTNFTLDSLMMPRPRAARTPSIVPPGIVFRTVCLDPALDLRAWAHQWAGDPMWQLGDAGQLLLERPLAPVPASHVRWRAEARVRFRGVGLVRFARVTIEIALWGGGVAEISVRPRARAVHLWDTPRQARYFTLAHRAADELARRLPECPVAPVSRMRVTCATAGYAPVDVAA